MSGLPIGLMIEGLVAILLLVTIGYCVLLNMRLKRFRADEQALKATISELVTATEIAERAIHALKATAGDADKTLGQRLTSAESVIADLSRLVEAADRVRTLPVTSEPLRPSPEALRPHTSRHTGFAARSAFATARN